MSLGGRCLERVPKVKCFSSLLPISQYSPSIPDASPIPILIPDASDHSPLNLLRVFESPQRFLEVFITLIKHGLDDVSNKSCS